MFLLKPGLITLAFFIALFFDYIRDTFLCIFEKIK